MKLFFKRVCSSLLALIFLLTVCSACAKDKQYADGISCEELMNTAKEAVASELGYTELGNEQILYELGETNAYDGVCLRYSLRAETIDEIGIFHSADGEKAKETANLVRAYLSKMKEDQEAFIASYAPEELPKLEKAEVWQFGNYTVYAILSDGERQAVKQLLEDHLTVNRPKSSQSQS